MNLQKSSLPVAAPALELVAATAMDAWRSPALLPAIAKLGGADQVLLEDVEDAQPIHPRGLSSQRCAQAEQRRGLLGRVGGRAGTSTPDCRRLIIAAHRD